MRDRITNILERHGMPERLELLQALVDEISWAFAGAAHQLRREGRGRPVDGAEKLLAVRIPQVLKDRGVQGNWLQGDNGEIGIVSEIEAVALGALRQSRDQERQTMSRPARTSDARKLLGKVYRNDPLPKFDQNN
ncbi:hypothetical protein [Bradyrhizobium sp. S69]|uniref:hypothetical protein n=1 Tax=Bradyrhizobium sp. S69 TaxID=1641856 RepID=UPI00131C15A7|nr:hypothetical protein [Bradyrhizobium sp. S69]